MNKKKPFINVLLFKWKILSIPACIQKINEKYKNNEGSFVINETNCMGIDSTDLMALEEIQKIKNIIVLLMPEAEMLTQEFQDDSLNTEDFIELYISHQDICIKKIKELFCHQ